MIKKLVVELPAELHKQFKTLVFLQERTQKDVVIELIEKYCEQEQQKGGKKQKK